MENRGIIKSWAIREISMKKENGLKIASITLFFLGIVGVFFAISLGVYAMIAPLVLVSITAALVFGAS
jgi:hypothetical protein